MKFSQTFVLAALLGSLSYQQVNAVTLKQSEAQHLAIDMDSVQMKHKKHHKKHHKKAKAQVQTQDDEAPAAAPAPAPAKGPSKSEKAAAAKAEAEAAPKPAADPVAEKVAADKEVVQKTKAADAAAKDAAAA